MAHCEDYIELISAAVDGALSPNQQEKLNAHLASCAECQKLYDNLSALHAALADLPPVEVPEGLKDRIMDAVAAEAENAKVLPFVPKEKKRSPIHWQRWLASAAVLAVVVMGTWSWKPWEVHEPQANSPRYNEVTSDLGMDITSFTVTGTAGAADGAVPAAPARQPSSLSVPADAPAETAPAAMPKLASAPLDATAPAADLTTESADAPAEKNAVRSGKEAPSLSPNVGAAAQGVETAVPDHDETVYGYASVGQAPEVSVPENVPAVQTAPAESGDTIAPQSAVMPRLFSAPIPSDAGESNGSGDSQPSDAPQLSPTAPSVQAIPSPAGEEVPEQGVISRIDAVNALVSRFYDGQVEHIKVTEEESGVRYTVGISPDAYWLGGASGVIVYVDEDEEVYLFDAKNDFSDQWIHLSVNKRTSEIIELEEEEQPSAPASN